ncbi:predicted protein [Arabidopsis lyrata subsp. lyrata]|uniref:Predicted protein n=1 Tax=Arabidopsis lyrata subsp. lyrata TaxID=81972 RepID=D7LGU5_ARALL|nr:predicted protein [Arabidopsis lyrata subsp. lyrata]
MTHHRRFVSVLPLASLEISEEPSQTSAGRSTTTSPPTGATRSPTVSKFLLTSEDQGVDLPSCRVLPRWPDVFRRRQPLFPIVVPVTKTAELDLSLVLLLLGLVSPLMSAGFFPSPHKLIYVVGFTVVPSGVLSSVFTDFFPRLYSFTEKPSSFTERPSSFTERPSSFMERSLPPISSSLERTLPSSSFLKERPFSSFLFYMKSVCQSSAFMAFRA